MRVASRSLLALFVTALIVGLMVGGGSAQATFPGANGKIAFVSNSEIYVMNPDGSEQTRLTDNSAANLFPAWSPDGSRIVFTRSRFEPLITDEASGDRDGDSEIYLMNADGSDQTKLTENQALDGDPAWSPDGSQIAFTSTRDGNWEIYVMDADGSEQKNLTDNPAYDVRPAWSPDGSQIAFVSRRDGHAEVYVMDSDGSDQKKLTNNPKNKPANDSGVVSWSPDGSQIAFIAGRSGDIDIYVVNVNGSGQTNLTNSPTVDLFPAWSPDGSQIAFYSNQDPRGIYVMNGDGSGRTSLAAGLAFIWSPDGLQIAFMSTRDGNTDIYVVNGDGSGERRLTNNLAGNFSPNWQPLATLPSTGSGGDGAGGRSVAWLIAALVGTGLAAATGYGALRLRRQ